MFAWKIPWTEEPGRLQSMGSRRIRHNWSDLAAARLKCNWWGQNSFKEKLKFAQIFQWLNINMWLTVFRRRHAVWHMKSKHLCLPDIEYETNSGVMRMRTIWYNTRSYRLTLNYYNKLTKNMWTNLKKKPCFRNL